MAGTITYSPQSKYGLSLVAFGFTGTRYTWRRQSYIAGTVTPMVTIASSTGAVNTIYDAAFPLAGISSWTVSTELGESADVTIDPADLWPGDLPEAGWLGDLASPTVHGVPVTVEYQRAILWQPASVIYEVLGKSVPLIITAPSRDTTFELAVILGNTPGLGTPTQVTRDLRYLLYSGRMLTLRSMCPDRVEDITFAVIDATEDPWGQAGPDRRVVIRARLADPTPPVGGASAASNWAAVATLYPSWADLVAVNPTWDDLQWPAVLAVSAVGLPG